MKDEKVIMLQLSAFRLFKTKGLKQVKRLYPDMVSFVKDNQNKSYDTLQKELLKEGSKVYTHPPA